ncbi:MAG: DUF1822 family protein [Oscillatoria sp. SIO1A7]|nr:DUF1822 family protein [Oscillatoria sp. SIO1A7]
MIPKITILEEKSIPIATPLNVRSLAREFAAEQPTPPKAERVYFNTLAVCAVNNYLRMMGIATDPSAGDSWNPVVRLAADIADLEVTGLGRLECRPINFARVKSARVKSAGINSVPSIESIESCYVPPEVLDDRIGYVVVLIDDELQEATLLGFAKTATREQLALSELQSMDEFLEYMALLESPSSKPLLNLSEWLEGAIAEGWEFLDNLMEPGLGALTPARGPGTLGEIREVKAAKLLDLGIELGGRRVTLLVALTPQGDDNTVVRMQLHPIPGETYLPANLKLAILSETGEMLREVRSRSLDNFIQLPPFQGTAGEKFQIAIALDGTTLTEAFII